MYIYDISQEKAEKIKAEGKGFGYGRAVRRLGATVTALEDDMDKLEKVFPQVHTLEIKITSDLTAAL